MTRAKPWDLAATTDLLTKSGQPVSACRRLPDNSGWQLRLEAGQVASLYNNGNFLVQGREPRDPVRELLRQAQQRIVGLEPAKPRGNGDANARSQPVFVEQEPSEAERLSTELAGIGGPVAILQRYGSGNFEVLSEAEDPFAYRLLRRLLPPGYQAPPKQDT